MSSINDVISYLNYVIGDPHICGNEMNHSYHVSLGYAGIVIIRTISGLCESESELF